MAKAITDAQLKSIAKMIRDWPQEHAFNWDNICVASKSIIGYTPTRQALSGKPIVKNAYLTKKKLRRDALARTKGIPRPQSMPDAINRIMRLQQENDALKAELEKMAEVAQRFIYNASMHGLPKQKLMAPLPKIRRK